MKILVVGSGGREHALAWKLARSPRVSAVFSAPGNAGLAQVSECLPINPENLESLAAEADRRGIDLTLVGPEAPLAAGIVDFFTDRGLRVVGPTRHAAQLESSKVFTKEFMKRHSIPTADFRVFSDPDEARSHIRSRSAPMVLKADGLAAGKGVIVCRTIDEAEDAFQKIMIDRAFGAAGDLMVVEDLLEGEEASYLVFSDGEHVLPLPSSQDHKPIYDNDQGPNTGGMGAYSPAPVVTPEIEADVLEAVIRPTIRGMAAEGNPYRGILYAGLMITSDGPQTLEFNCRFGDPEAQPILMRLQSDLVEPLEATINGTLDRVDLRWDPRPAVCVVMASGGYPGSYAKGYPIEGLEAAGAMDDVQVFQAGTVLKDGRVVTNGGRVLGVTALGNAVPEAITRAYQAVKEISFTDVYYRTDIGRKALERERGEK